MFLASCQDEEYLPTNPFYPADIFTSCLTTPLKVAILYYIQNSLLMNWDASLIDKIPGVLNNRRTPLGELNWIFTAVTDTIAWNVLPRPLFYKLFRQDLLIASLFRNFFLAQRVMQSLKCKPISYPVMPDASNHHMWVVWDRALELCLLQIVNHGNSVNDSTSSFFDEQLLAFDVWLQTDSIANQTAEQLPIILQVLLSQTLREKALLLLCKFLDLGPWACDQAVAVGLITYVLKLLSSTTSVSFYKYLVFCWMKLLVVDSKKEFHLKIIRENQHFYFLNVLKTETKKDLTSDTNSYALFILTTLLEEKPQVKIALIQQNLLEEIYNTLKSPNVEVRSWCLLCLHKLLDGSPEIKQIIVKLPLLNKFRELIQDPCSRVRVALLTCLISLYSEPLVEMGQFNNDIMTSSAILIHDACPRVRQLLLVFYSKLARVILPQNQHIDLFNEAIQIGLRDPDPDVESIAQVAREILSVYTSKDEQKRTSSPKRKINIMNTVTNQIYESRVYELSQPLLKSKKHVTAEQKWYRNQNIERRALFVLHGNDYETRKLKQCKRIIKEEQDNFNPGQMLFHPILPLLVIGSKKGSTIKVFDNKNEVIVNEWGNGNSFESVITGMCWLNKTDVPLLATATNDRSIRIWRDWDNQGASLLVSSFIGISEKEKLLNDVGVNVLSLGETKLLTSGGKMFSIWDLEREETEISYTTKSNITCINYFDENNDNQFIAGYVNGDVIVYDMRTREKEVQCWNIANNSIIFSCSKPSSGSTIVAGSISQTASYNGACLIDVRMNGVNEQMKRVSIPRVSNLIAHPIANYFIAGSSEQFIRTYDSSSGTRLQEIKYYEGMFGHRIGAVSSMAITPYDFAVAVAMADGNVTLFNFD